MTLRRRFHAPVGVDGSAALRRSGDRTTPKMAAARLARRVRARHLVVADVVGVTLAGALAVVVRYDGLDPASQLAAFAPAIAMLVVIRVAVGIPLGLYRRDWRSASTPELERIVAAVSLGTLIAIALWLVGILVGVMWAEVVPRTFWLTEMVLSGAAIGGARLSIRAASDWRRSRRPAPSVDTRATLLYGAGDTGVRVARSAQREPEAGIVPVGFLDDDPMLYGRLVAGVRVHGGLDALPNAARATGARTLLITMPRADGDAIRRVVDAAMDLQLEVRTVPSLIDLMDGTIDARRIREVRVEDLLRRPIVTSQHAGAVHELLRDRVVLVTGAGGSIGSELARQVHAIGPRRLVLVDRAESPLYLVERELETREGTLHSGTELSVELADVTDAGRMERLIDLERPDVVFHAAAFKHVPLMEQHPSLAVQVNAGGTMAVLDAAERAGVERFVLVSTDKAVRPSSVMGATKRVAEMLVAEAAERTGRAYVSVRFGNVLGSNGSVLPVFQSQLEKGEPLTITHADATRYFMTIPEAAWLILDAAAIGRPGGDLFVLDMGSPILILDLARDLIRLAGRDPDAYPVEIVGLRPGEKLHEQLFYDAEQVESTTSAKVLRASTDCPQADIRSTVLRLIELADGLDDRSLRSALFATTWAADDGGMGPEDAVGMPVMARAAGDHDGRRSSSEDALATGRALPS